MPKAPVRYDRAISLVIGRDEEKAIDAIRDAVERETGKRPSRSRAIRIALLNSHTGSQHAA